MVSVHTSLPGIFISAVFSVVMGSLLWWMLHPPKAISLMAAKVKVAVDAIKVILVPTVGTEYSERGIELACRLGLEQNALIRLVHIVEVPLALPLGVELPAQEEAANKVLATGKEIVGTHKMTADVRVERARHAAEKIADMAAKENIGLIVMGIRPKVGGVESLIGRTSETLLRRLPCEIIIDANPFQAA